MAQSKKLYILYYCSKTRDTNRDEWSPGVEAADKMLYSVLDRHPCLSYLGAINVAQNKRNREMGVSPAFRPLQPYDMSERYVWVNKNFRFRENMVPTNIGSKSWPTLVILTDDDCTPYQNKFIVLDRDNDTDVRSKLEEFLLKCEAACEYFPNQKAA